MAVAYVALLSLVCCLPLKVKDQGHKVICFCRTPLQQKGCFFEKKLRKKNFLVCESSSFGAQSNCGMRHCSANFRSSGQRSRSTSKSRGCCLPLFFNWKKDSVPGQNECDEGSPKSVIIANPVPVEGSWWSQYRSEGRGSSAGVVVKPVLVEGS